MITWTLEGAGLLTLLVGEVLFATQTDRVFCGQMLFGPDGEIISSGLSETCMQIGPWTFPSAFTPVFQWALPVALIAVGLGLKLIGEAIVSAADDRNANGG